ncbi:PEP-CTERM sorting domain-containing protein [Haloferula sp.]|uniref:PEP-CTERM sorting domain-containing protein n=1 Tax=Haloferula sp. TaxID=2497595 RepID=UPI003C77E2EC
MKTKIALLAFLAISGSSLMAASISVDMFADTAGTTSGGVLLGNGFTAYIGTYTGPSNPATTFEAIQAGFNSIGSIAFATGAAAGYDGYFNTGAIAFTDAAGVGGQAVYVHLTDGGVQNALFTGAALGTFKFDADIPNSGTASIQASNAGELTYLVGSYNPTGTSPFGGGTIELTPIPEPSMVFLSALGVFGLLRRKR